MSEFFQFLKNTIQKKEGVYLLCASWLLGTFLGIPGGYFFHMSKFECKQQTCESETSAKKTITEEPIMEEPVVEKVEIHKADIRGAVKYPGVYEFEEGQVLDDIVKKAGGVLPSYASSFVSKYINMSSKLKDQQKIYIPFQQDVICEEIQFSKEVVEVYEEIINKPVENQTEETVEESSSCININNATLEQLTELDGVGPSTAQKIIDGRPYTKIEDILEVKGIGDATYAKFKDQICI